MKNVLLLFALLYSVGFSAQQNYEWLKLNPYKTAVLSDTLKENSGLVFFNGRLFTLNDSGNASEIYEIETKKGLIKNVNKIPSENIDWEAITADSTHIYIGDFGNNLGVRKDLKVLRLNVDDSLTAEKIRSIPYFYPEQTDFSPRNLDNNYDAEAMIYLGGKIHIFTKEWSAKATSHYVINPLITDVQPAQKVESYKTDYVVTDAAYFSSRLYLVGYTKKAEVFLTIFQESEPGIFFKNKPRKFYLGSSLQIGQIEGIAADEQGIYISGEELNMSFIKVKPALYFIPFDKLK